MNFEVSGIGYPNKGAELMLRAVGEALKREYGNETVVASIPAQSSDVGFRCVGLNGYHLRFSLVIQGRDVGPFLGRFLPRQLLRSYGCVAQHEIDCVFDASGLRYSDKWGAGTMKRSIRDYKRVKANGGCIVLLPQAFGPFENPAIQSMLSELIDLADLVYARDAVSCELLTDVVGVQPKIRIAPDFTPLVSGVRPVDRDLFAGKVCVVPNARMLDMTSGRVGQEYLSMLRRVVMRVKEAGLELFVLNHEGQGDAEICEDFANSFDVPLPYTGIRGAREVKGIIGCAAGLVTSRFHGLVSGLSQGVPSLSTSWNHKYEELCHAYGTSESIIDPSDKFGLNMERVELWLDRICDGTNSHASELLRRATEHKERIHLMWEEVFEQLG